MADTAYSLPLHTSSLLSATILPVASFTVTITLIGTNTVTELMTAGTVDDPIYA